MNHQTLLIERYQYSYALAKKQMEGISDEEALIHPTWGGNCINWIAGHLVVARCNLLVMLKQPSVWDMNTCRRYIPGSNPMVKEENAESMAEITTAFDRSQSELIRAFRQASQESLDMIHDELSVLQHLHEYNAHECFHAGQLEVLKQMILGG